MKGGIIKIYKIKIDGKWYCGEGYPRYTQIPPHANGFHQQTNHGASGLKLSRKKADAILISGKTNLKGHLEKIFRCTEAEKVVIEAV